MRAWCWPSEPTPATPQRILPGERLNIPAWQGIPAPVATRETPSAPGRPAEVERDQVVLQRQPVLVGIGVVVGTVRHVEEHRLFVTGIFHRMEHSDRNVEDG